MCVCVCLFVCDGSENWDTFFPGMLWGRMAEHFIDLAGCLFLHLIFS